MQRHKGFSLLEILVAFAIMAVAVTIVLRIFGSGVHNIAISEEYSLAVQIAESLMAKTGVESPLAIGEISGTEADKFDWLVTVNFLAKTTNTNTGNTANMLGNLQNQGDSGSLYSVKVQVFWGDDAGSRRSISIRSLKML